MVLFQRHDDGNMTKETDSPMGGQGTRRVTHTDCASKIPFKGRGLQPNSVLQAQLLKSHTPALDSSIADWGEARGTSLQHTDILRSLRSKGILLLSCNGKSPSSHKNVPF